MKHYRWHFFFQEDSAVVRCACNTVQLLQSCRLLFSWNLPLPNSPDLNAANTNQSPVYKKLCYASAVQRLLLTFIRRHPFYVYCVHCGMSVVLIKNDDDENDELQGIGSHTSAWVWVVSQKHWRNQAATMVAFYNALIQHLSEDVIFVFSRFAR